MLREGGLVMLREGGREGYTIQYYTILYNTIQYYTILYNTIQYNTIQYNTIQYDAILYNTIQYYTIQYYTIQWGGREGRELYTNNCLTQSMVMFLSGKLWWGQPYHQHTIVFYLYNVLLYLWVLKPLTNQAPSYHIIIFSLKGEPVGTWWSHCNVL